MRRIPECITKSWREPNGTFWTAIHCSEHGLVFEAPGPLGANHKHQWGCHLLSWHSDDSLKPANPMETKSEKNNGLDCWALVELFGHQKIVGKVTEATIAGGAFIRVDVPALEEKSAFTRFFGPGAIYSLNPVTEAVAMELLQRHRNEPVSEWDVPRLALPERTPEAEESHESEI